MEFEGLPPHVVRKVLRRIREYCRLKRKAWQYERKGQEVPLEIRIKLKICETDLHNRPIAYLHYISRHPISSHHRLIARITRTGCCKNCQSSVPKHLLPRIIQQLALAACDGCQAILMPASCR